MLQLLTLPEKSNGCRYRSVCYSWSKLSGLAALIEPICIGDQLHKCGGKVADNQPDFAGSDRTAASLFARISFYINPNCFNHFGVFLNSVSKQTAWLQKNSA
jgi:hypothetical protein